MIKIHIYIWFLTRNSKKQGVQVGVQVGVQLTMQQKLAPKYIKKIFKLVVYKKHLALALIHFKNPYVVHFLYLVS